MFSDFTQRHCAVLLIFDEKWVTEMFNPKWIPLFDWNKKPTAGWSVKLSVNNSCPSFGSQRGVMCLIQSRSVLEVLELMIRVLPWIQSLNEPKSLMVWGRQHNTVQKCANTQKNKIKRTHTHTCQLANSLAAVGSELLCSSPPETVSARDESGPSCTSDLCKNANHKNQ